MKTTAYTYNGPDQLVTETGTDTGNASISKTYGYDANGNQISETDSNTGTTVENSYDAVNQLTKSVVSQNGAAVLTQRNAYNGNGQKVCKTEVTVQYENGETARDGTEATVSTGYHYQNGIVSYTTDSSGDKLISSR